MNSFEFIDKPINIVSLWKVPNLQMLRVQIIENFLYKILISLSA